ncbi:MAG: tRNA (N(6)-L-threonylcarbamoyladenosine(37)-C(2))-methylthiotransferase MtaB [Marinilabiliales bacterium]|nr:tRNA (N(6)-L-threonylcarbamoyladenosine(37)-C(2))-methylthiotransferase MtaB [Marinilabiliales bacterium]
MWPLFYMMQYRDKKVAFGTLGCKLNFSETSTIARSFQEKGFTRVDFKEPADVYVINTCSVTDSADKKSRGLIRQATRQNPAAFVVVIGCYAQLKPEEAASIEGVDLILGANDKFNITKYLENLEKHNHSEVHGCTFQEMTAFHAASSFGDRTRSFLKVQDGCNYFCTYCTIPLARGKSRNPSIAELVTETRNLARQGIREINLTGVNIGDFGRSTGETFQDLLKSLEAVDEIARIRMGSVEPNLLTEEIIRMVAGSAKLAPHFHIPLQSGSDEVLELMKRKYDTALFRQRIDLIRHHLPDAFIGVDVIAGMNGETETLFQQAYQFIEGLDVSQLHAFPYSERANTRALEIDGVVPVQRRKERTQQLIQLSQQKLAGFYGRQLGKEAVVLFENQQDRRFAAGWTENYVRVKVPFQEQLLNQTVRVRLESVMEEGTLSAVLI